MGVIDDIKTNLGNAYTKLATKGATIPAHKNMENLENAIDSVAVAKEEQAKTVELSMASGNQVVTPDQNKALSQVTITKPATLTAGNIKKDVNIGGVVGTLEEGITPTGNINITDTNQTDVTNYATAQVVDTNLTAGNIKNGVSILGVQGTALVTTITVNQDNSIDLTIA